MMLRGLRRFSSRATSKAQALIIADGPVDAVDHDEEALIVAPDAVFIPSACGLPHSRSVLLPKTQSLPIFPQGSGGICQ
jgi:hypothetical protein